MVGFARTIIMYTLVIIVMRCMGKRQIGQLQPYEFVIALMISDVASIPMQDIAVPLWNGIIPILSLLLLQLIISFLILKHKSIRNWVCGRPCVLIRRGTILESALRNQMYNLDDLLEALRVKGFPKVDDVMMAVLENNGELSVLPYSRAEPPQRSDFGLQTAENLITDLIVGGYVMKDNLALCGISKETLKGEIVKCGGKSF
ncbi:MAG: DUF421 domain-containing protein, partial [Clostridia bacterium]|nr:DUF421 domain-containing protein [Clostridia bacterium]